MTGRTLVVLAFLSFFELRVLATSCSVPPPCGRISVNSVLFVGTVVDAGVVAHLSDETIHEVRFQVDEVFAGLSPPPKEVTVRTQGTWEKGHSYLVDAAIGGDGHLYPRICGSSGDVLDQSIAEDLDYLRRRAQGKTNTSLAVWVADQHKPVPDVAITITGPEGSLTRHTDADGTAIFDPVKPAKYRVAAAREHYRIDADFHNDEDVDVLTGTCATAMVALEAEGAVSGFVRDSNGAPMASLQLELITASADPSKRLSLSEPFFEVKTDGDGRFRFESVSPGRYLLGSNVLGLNTSPVPPTYYPGRRTRDGAVPIEVKLGGTVDNLIFTLPDFGGPREIQVCTVDESGRPLPSVGIGTDLLTEGDFGSLGEKLQTNEAGCVKVRGYTHVAYSLLAMFRPPGTDIRHGLVSDSVVIDPGEKPVRQILILRPIGSAKFRH